MAEDRETELETHLREVVNVTWDFAGRLTTPEAHEQNALIGLASEAGETLDIGKKKWFHDEKPDTYFREKLVLELGDIVYYLLKTLDVFGITLEEVLARNREKLASRHPEMGSVATRYDGNHIR